MVEENKKIRILIVEDSPDDASLFLRELQKAGYETEHQRVETKTQLEAAPALGSWDLILADYSQPHFSAHAVLKLLKENSIYLPVIVVSGSAEEEAVVATIKAGADDYLMKSNLKRLVPVIEGALRGAKLRLESRLMEERYQILFDSYPHPSWVCDLETLAFLAVNDVACSHYGYTREEFLNMTTADIRPPEDVPKLKEFLSNNTDHTYNAGIWRHRKKDGTIIYVEVSGRYLLFKGRRAVLVLMTDVTARRQAEEELKKQNYLNETLLSTQNKLGEGVIMTEEERVVFINDAVCAMLGYTREELMAHPDINELVVPEFKARAEERRQRRQAGQAMDERYETAVFHKGGHRVELEIATRSINSNNHIQYIALLRDITERKKTERILWEKEKRFRVLIENSSDAIALINLEGIIQYASPSTEAVLGYGNGEFVGRSAFEFIHPDDMERTRELLEELLKEPNRQVVAEYRVRYKDGPWLWMEGVARNLLAEPAVGAVVVNYRDITERKQVERELIDSNLKLTGRVGELQVRNRESTVLSEMGDLLQNSLDLEEAYKIITLSAQKLFPEFPGALCRFQPAGRTLEVVAVWGEPLLGETGFGPEDCWALRKGQIHFVEDLQKGLVCRHLSRPLWGGYFCLPMMAQGETLGILHLQGGPHSWQQAAGEWKKRMESHLRLAQTAAEQIALNLANLKIRDTLARRSVRDPLTGLFNRRYLEDSLEREFSRSVRSQKPLGIIMLDLDGFKQFNDAFGHVAGDAILRALGDFLLKKTRGEDIACRYGGEEFTLILPGASLEVTRQRAEDLREGIKRLSVEFARHLTISVGVAVFPEHGLTKESILRAADGALYCAKNGGRDQVAIAEPPGEITSGA